jgi:CHASE3 domain sensor protein
MTSIKEIRERAREIERAREEKLQNRFNADTKDIVAFTIAAWQLFLPLVVAFIIVGVIVYFLLNLF